MYRTRKTEDEIKMYLCFIENYVKSEVKERWTDAAKACENIMKNLLNIVYKTDMSNLNEIKHDYPAIDLLDKNNGIVYQITATYTGEKINDTVKKYDHIADKEDICKEVRRLIVLMLKYDIDEQKKGFKDYRSSRIDFVVERDVLGLKTILDEAIRNKSIEEVHAYLENECLPAIHPTDGTKWKQVPSFIITAKAIEIIPFNDDYIYSMLYHYSGTVNFSNDYPIYRFDLTIKNITEVPITSVKIKAFTMGAITEIHPQEYVFDPMVNENKQVQEVSTVIYPNDCQTISFLFCDNRDTDEESELLSIVFGASVSSSYSKHHSEHLYYLICSSVEKSTDDDFPCGKYNIDDISISILPY